MKQTLFITFFLALLGIVINLQAADDPLEVIIEKNLFNDDRKAWIMEKSDDKQEKEVKKPKPKEDPSKLELMGTVIVGESKKAIIRTSKRSSDQGSAIYLPGDYIDGYLVKEIDERSVVLNNNYSNEDIVIFLHEGKTKRSSQKTEIVPAPYELERQARERAQKGGSGSEAGSKAKQPIKPKKAETGVELKKKFQRTLRLLKSKNSRLVKKQAERDYQKLHKLLPFMAEGDRTEVLELKKEMDQLLAGK